MMAFKLNSLAVLLPSLIALAAAIPAPGKLNSDGKWKRPDFKWAAYTWEVVETGQENVRQIVSTIDGDMMMISTMGENRWPPESETILNSNTMKAVLVPQSFGPCYYFKFEDSPVKENMEKWNTDEEVDISGKPVIELDGTAEKMSMEEAKELLKDEQMMLMRCMWKGVIATKQLEGGETENTQMEEVISYGSKVKLLVPKGDHSMPEWLKPFLDKMQKKWANKAISDGNKKWKPLEKKGDGDSHVTRVRNIVSDVLKKIKNKGNKSSDEKKGTPKIEDVANKVKDVADKVKGVANKVKDMFKKWKKN